jgi:Family of unknown function (DUF6527)
MRAKKWVASNGEQGLLFWCPGCNEHHKVKTAPQGWGWNGDLEMVTLTPSVLVTSGHYIAGHDPEKSCWCKYNADKISKGEVPSNFTCSICHSFVTGGKIQFLSDCSHALAGQTIDLPNIDDQRDSL